jgi:L-amino acid N-acyltransferase YncA
MMPSPTFSAERTNAESDLRLRLMTPDEGPRFAALARKCPDTGSVSTLVSYQIDPVVAFSALRSETMTVIAEAPSDDALAGAVCASFTSSWFEGHESSSVMLHSMMVAPSRRRKGLSDELLRFVFGHIRRREGDEAVLVAAVQPSNADSIRTVVKFFRQRGGAVTGFAIGMRKRAPWFERGISVRPSEPTDLGEIASRLNAFYEGYNLHTPETPESLRAWLERSPFDTPFRHYRVAKDRRGNVVAGLGVTEQSRIRTLEVKSMPLVMRLANEIVRLLPRDRVLRQATVDKAWFLPGHEAAGRRLFETARWEFRDRATALVCFHDPRSPVRAMLRAPVWLPRTTMTLWIDAPRPARDQTLLYPFI